MLSLHYSKKVALSFDSNNKVILPMDVRKDALLMSEQLETEGRGSRQWKYVTTRVSEYVHHPVSPKRVKAQVYSMLICICFMK